uniref:Metallothionein n=1 Tax=Oncorhynchus tshawytscha TaxID=74940 RepID=A0A8C8EIB2_ONCTS
MVKWILVECCKTGLCNCGGSCKCSNCMHQLSERKLLRLLSLRLQQVCLRLVCRGKTCDTSWPGV